MPPNNFDSALFKSTIGHRFSTDSRKMAKTARRQEVPTHALRHVCLNNLVQAGNDTVIVLRSAVARSWKQREDILCQTNLIKKWECGIFSISIKRT